MASWLVIDWDQDQFHLLSVQISRRGMQVGKAQSWAHPEPFTPSTADRVGKALREFVKAEKIPVASVLFGVGRDRVIMKELHFPPIAAHEEAALVRFQTAKELTEGIDNYAVDYAHLTPTDSGERQVMSVAMRRDLVTMIQTLCQSAGLKLHAITPRLFGVAPALTNAVAPEASPLAQNRRNVVVSLGQRWAELCFFHGARLVQSQALARGPLAAEIRRSLAVFQAQHAVDVDVVGPECLYLFGDDGEMLKSLEAGLNLPIVNLSPFGLKSEVSAPNPGSFAGALGLAVLWNEPIRRPINLAAPKRQQAPTSVGRQRGMLYGATAALAFLFLFGSMYYVLAQKRAELKRLTAELDQMEDTLKLTAQERADIEAFKDWDQSNIRWLDELYDLTARYPHEIGFRVDRFAASSTGKKGGKDGFVGRINLVGVTPNGKEAFVNQLHSSMARDPHVQAAIDRIRGQEFVMKIDLAKQPAVKYDTRLIVPRLVAPAPEPPPAATEIEARDADTSAEGANR